MQDLTTSVYISEDLSKGDSLYVEPTEYICKFLQHGQAECRGVEGANVRCVKGQRVRSETASGLLHNSGQIVHWGVL